MRFTTTVLVLTFCLIAYQMGKRSVDVESNRDYTAQAWGNYSQQHAGYCVQNSPKGQLCTSEDLGTIPKCVCYEKGKRIR